jgi:hypothetical protein
VWRSLVARFVRDEEVVGSNPATPTQVRGLFAIFLSDRLRAYAAATAAVCRCLRLSPSRLSAPRVSSVGMCVHVHRDRDLAVPHAPHRDARVHVERSQQGRAGVPRVMDANGSYACPGTSNGEAAIEVTWINGLPNFVMNTMAAIRPGRRPRHSSLRRPHPRRLREAEALAGDAKRWR